MTEKKWRRFFKKEMDKEMAEIEGILEEMNNNPETKDVVAPQEMHDGLIAMIREAEAKKARLTEEEKELIRLGKVYKKKKKKKKYYVLLAAAIGVLAVGITSFGGPMKIIERVQGLLGGREKVNVDTEDDRVDEVVTISEAEAYQQIEDEFGVNFVQLYYLPEGVEFDALNLNSITQNANISYVGKNKESIIYSIYPHFRTGSIGQNVEDILLEEYSREIEGTIINVTKYLIEENQTEFYVAKFEYSSVSYFLEMTNIEKDDVNKIIENLYFR